MRRFETVGRALTAADQRRISGRESWVCFVEYTDDTWDFVYVDASGPMDAKVKAGTGFNGVWATTCCTEAALNAYLGQ